MQKRTTSITLAALLVTSLFTAASPVLARDHGQRGPDARQHLRGHDSGDFRRMDQRMGQRDGLRGGFLALVCDERGADRLEHVLLTLKQRTDLTAAQQPLYDALQTAALTAQADFAAACTAARPAQPEAGASIDLADHLRANLEIEQARVEAMGKVVPAFEAFYDSLGEAQKATLMPQRRAAERHFSHGRHAPQPARPGAPAEPATPLQKG